MDRRIEIGGLGLEGMLSIPASASGIVIFAHGSGSSRFSPRNTHVAKVLNAHGLATLLFDLLTESEAEDRANVFNIPLLGARIGEAIDCVYSESGSKGLPIGLFGASTGAAATLVAAADAPDKVAAVVSRGGRPDLAGSALPRVKAPTLLIVGGADFGVVELNKAALTDLTCRKQLAIVPGATHLFEQAGAMEKVIDLARNWFAQHLRGRQR